MILDPTTPNDLRKIAQDTEACAFRVYHNVISYLRYRASLGDTRIALKFELVGRNEAVLALVHTWLTAKLYPIGVGNKPGLMYDLADTWVMVLLDYEKFK